MNEMGMKKAEMTPKQWSCLLSGHADRLPSIFDVFCLIFPPF